MYIIFGDQPAQALRDNYAVFELEIIKKNNVEQRAYCVVPADKIPIHEIPQLKHYQQFHSDFVRAYENQNYDFCVQAAEHLLGKFGGELDSFYVEILKRINAK